MRIVEGPAAKIPPIDLSRGSEPPPKGEARMSTNLGSGSSRYGAKKGEKQKKKEKANGTRTEKNGGSPIVVQGGKSLLGGAAPGRSPRITIALPAGTLSDPNHLTAVQRQVRG